MCNVSRNILFKGATGRLGDKFFRTVRGETHLVNRPARRGSFSKSQKAGQSRFVKATQYAKEQVGEFNSKTLYEQGITKKKHNAYLVAMSDFLNAPEVHYIDAERYCGNVGDMIAVMATDDFMVVGVKIVITGSDGKVIEEGEASPDPKIPGRWKYRTVTSNLSVVGSTIRAIAFDRPGNAGAMEKVL